MEETNNNIPTEVVELPSKGVLYPEDNPLSSGSVRMRYMTAKHEDILTNQSYILDGTVLDKLLQELIVDDINYDDLIVGDKNAIMVAARVLGYGNEYAFEYKGKEEVVDLSKLENKEIDTSLFTKGVNSFEYTVPSNGTKLTFKLLTHGDEQKINEEIQGLKKINPKASPDVSTRLKFMITSVNGDDKMATIRDYVDNHLLARDSRELRKHIQKFQPDVELRFYPDGSTTGNDIPIGVKFFWPDI